MIKKISTIMFNYVTLWATNVYIYKGKKILCIKRNMQQPVQSIWGRSIKIQLIILILLSNVCSTYLNYYTYAYIYINKYIFWNKYICTDYI